MGAQESSAAFCSTSSPGGFEAASGCGRPVDPNRIRPMEVARTEKLKEERIDEWTGDMSQLTSIDHLMSCGTAKRSAPPSGYLADVQGGGAIVVSGDGPMWMNSREDNEGALKNASRVKRQIKTIKRKLAEHKRTPCLSAEEVVKLEDQLQLLSCEICDENEYVIAS